ncbi:MAG: hypothetical protein AB7F75_00450 [Planctomycetota bacterium]
MLKALTILNLFLGTSSLALYARLAGASALNPPSQDAMILLAVGVAGLGAAAGALKRTSIFMHGLAMCLFMAFAMGGESTGQASGELKGLLGRLPSKDGILPLAGMVLAGLASLMDVRTMKARRTKTPTPPDDIPQAPKPAQAPAQAAPETKVVRCTCGKPLRVSVKSKSARCPSCQSVLKLS